MMFLLLIFLDEITHCHEFDGVRVDANILNEIIHLTASSLIQECQNTILILEILLHSTVCTKLSLEFSSEVLVISE